MISDKELLAKLKNLKKEIHPSSTWVDFCRLWLERKMAVREQIIEASRQQAAASVQSIKVGFSWPLVLNKALAPVLVVFCFMVVGPVGLVLAAKNTLPGDFLFPIKITAEKARLALTSTGDRSKLRIEMTATRLYELNQLVDKGQGVRDDVMASAVEQLNQELAAVKDQLPIIAKESKKLEEVAKIAKTAVELTNRMSANAVLSGSSCAGFASSSCALLELEKENQSLPPVQTLKMAKEIIKNIEELSKKGSSGTSTQSVEPVSQNLR